MRQPIRLPGVCERCKRDRLINLKKLCESCHVYVHRDVEKTKQRVAAWAKKNTKYFRDYQRRKNNTKPENYQKE